MLTPVDIENKEFAKAFRGYDSIEVDEFMRSLVADYEKLYRENNSLKEKNALLTETLENYKGMETTMQNAILVAQKTAEDIKQNAYDRSNTIVKEAEIKAGNIITESEKRAGELEKEYSALKKEMNTFKARMNSLLNTYLRLLDDMPDNERAIDAPTQELLTDLEKDIDKIQKQNQERNSLEEQIIEPTKEHNFKEQAEEIKPADKKPEIKEPEAETAYAPKKFNPLVDELLKKRNSGESLENTEKEEHENKAQNNVPNEIIINLANNGKPYDVFKDETL